MTAVHFFVAFFEELLGFVFGGAFLKRDKPFDVKLPIILSTVTAVLQIIFDMINTPSAWQMLFAAALMFLFMKFYFSDSDGKTLTVDLGYCFILFICDLIAFMLFSFSEGAPEARMFNEHYPNSAVSVIVSRIILVLICLTVYMLIRRKRTRNTFIYVGVSLFATGLMFVFTAIFFSDISIETHSERAPFMYFFLLLFFIIAAMYAGIASFLNSRERRKRFELTRQQNRMLERSLREQEKTFGLWRKSVHDYKNTVLALDTMLENGELDKLSAYLEREKQSFMHRAEYIHSGNGVVDTVLNTKYAAALDNGVSFTVNASMPSRCGISDIHLASVIGNLIDNALEASDYEDDPYIEIKISEVQGFLMIKIVNKCSVPPETSGTSKQDSIHHGIGLQSVRDTVSDYDGQFDLSFEGGKAVAAVMLPIK